MLNINFSPEHKLNLKSFNNYWKEVLQRDGEATKNGIAIEEIHSAMNVLGPVKVLRMLSEFATMVENEK